MKKILFIVLVVIALGFFIHRINQLSLNDVGSSIRNDSYRHIQVKVGNRSFDTFVSDTEILRERGLSGFSGLSSDEAMLFIFPNADIYGFWMKDMLFPIDILWLDENFKIVSFKKNISPNTFPKIFFPDKPAMYVMEFRAGTLNALSLKVGDIVDVAIEKPSL